jgi:hypothetical protein
MFSFASNHYLQSFDTIIGFLMHNTQLESFPYSLGSLIAFYLIECVCRLERIFLCHKMSLVLILTEEYLQEQCLQGDLYRLH